MHRHLFVLGPSGSGKSHVSKHIGDRAAHLHIEIDPFGKGDGVDLENLRGEWDAYLLEGRAERLSENLDKRAVLSGKRACVLSFPSNLVLNPRHIFGALEAGISVKYLYGTAAACIGGFLARERESGRNLPVEHWLANNGAAYLEISKPAFRSFRVEVFDFEDNRRPLANVLAALTDD